MRFLYLPLVLALLPAPASAQSLGAAARKEEERRQKNKEKGVKAPLFDDSKISKKEPPSPSPAASPGTTTAAAPSKAPATAAATESSLDDAEAEQRRKQEEMWRGRMTAARARRDETKKAYDYLNSLVLGPGEYYVDDKGQVIVRDVEQLRQMITEAKAQWDAAEKAIGDLEDSARRAGALPGWLR
jgi:hypothetical protein